MRKSTFYVLATILVVIVTLSSCSSSKHKAEETNFNRIDSLRAHFLTIEDSLLYAWNVMIHDDNERISDLARLLDELQNAQVLDSNNVTELKAELKSMKNSRYNMTKMTSEQIDWYDSISFSMSGKIIGIILDFKEVGRYPYMNELIESVRNRESKILWYRVDYDKIAKEHNRFVDTHDSILNQIDPEYTHTHLPLFELTQEEL